MFDPNTDPNGRALKQRTQAVYDAEQQKLQAGPQDAFTVMNMMGNQRSAMSPMAPWFQALNEAAGGKKIKMAQGSSFGSDVPSTIGARAVDPYEASVNGNYGDLTQHSSALDTPSSQFGSGAPGSYGARRHAAIRGLQRANPRPGVGSQDANPATATEGF